MQSGCYSFPCDEQLIWSGDDSKKTLLDVNAIEISLLNPDGLLN